MATLVHRRGAATLALPECPGDLVLDVDHQCGSEQSMIPCEITVSIECINTRCWWSRGVEGGPVTAALFAEAADAHAADAAAQAQAWAAS